MKHIFAKEFSLNRRSFLKTSAFAAAGLTFTRLPVMAGPFTREDFDHLVPADKKLSPEWVKSLTARGERTVYRGAELKTIGMPVGGIACGQLYLGGDGKLWHWDIFNRHIGTGDGHYAKPPKPSSPLEQGFALRVTHGGKTQVRPLDRTGWKDISFIGEYPIGFVEYRDAEVPVTVSLERHRSEVGRAAVENLGAGIARRRDIKNRDGFSRCKTYFGQRSANRSTGGVGARP